jgi:DNA-binding protein HU-beta
MDCVAALRRNLPMVPDISTLSLIGAGTRHVPARSDLLQRAIDDGRQYFSQAQHAIEDIPVFMTFLDGCSRNHSVPVLSRGRYDVLEMVRCRCHKRLLKMTKTELQIALAQATQTNKKTAGAFLDTLGTLAYKEAKKNGEFVLPGFGKLVKQKRKARTGFNPKTQQKIKIPAKTVIKFRVAKAAKDAVLGVKK